MKMYLNLLAGAVIASGLSLSTWAQPADVTEPAVVISPPPVQSGSNASRAPLPVNKPNDYNRITLDKGQAADAIVVAKHIDGETPDQFATGTGSVQVGVPQVVGDTEPMLTPTGRSFVAAGAALDAGQMGPQIRSNAMASQDQLLAIEGRVAVSEQSIATMQGTTPDMNAEGRAQFTSANDEAKKKAKALRKSIQAARNATGEKLAADYEAYAAAVDRVDAAAGIAPAQR